MKGGSRVFVPDHGALPLIGDSHSGQVGGVEAGGVQSGLDAHLHVALQSCGGVKVESQGEEGERKSVNRGARMWQLETTPNVALAVGSKRNTETVRADLVNFSAVTSALCTAIGSSTLYSSTLHDIHAGRNDQFRTARLRGAVSDVTHKENELWMNEWKAQWAHRAGE